MRDTDFTALEAYIDEYCRKPEHEHNCGRCGHFLEVYYDLQIDVIICKDCLRTELEDEGYFQ